MARRTRERDRIWNVSQDLLLVADQSGAWLSVNPAWQRTLGWSEGELLSGMLPALIASATALLTIALSDEALASDTGIVDRDDDPRG